MSTIVNIVKKINFLLDQKLKIHTLLVLAAIVIGSFAELLGVSIILPIINLALDPEEVNNNRFCRLIVHFTGKTEINDILLIIICITILIYILKSVYLIWMNFAIYGYSMRFRTSIAMKLLTTYMKQPYTYFLGRNTSEIVRTINIDTKNFNSVINNLMHAISYGLTSAFLIVYLCTTNIGMTLLIAGLLALCAVGILLVVQKRVRRLGRENQYLTAKMIKYIEEAFSGIKEVKVLNKEDFFVGLCRDTYAKSADVTRKSALYEVIPKHMIEAVSIVGILGYMLINILWKGDIVSIIPQLSVFAIAAMRLLPSVNALYAYINVIIFNKASVDVVYEDVKESEHLNCLLIETETEEAWNLQDKIEVKDVSFAYNESNFVLKDINLEIKAGTSVALIGSSGGGKTTLADIILGVLTPQKGSIFVDGKDIQGHEKAWHQCIGYIPQSIFLMDDTIKRNIAFGIKDKDIDEEKLISCLKKAQLWEFVSGLEDGMDTIVGERGMRLSGGQRQRIGIARALYEDPKVLIFDEATSALDMATEGEVMQAIDALHGEKTIVMIAHRLSTIENCDHVYKVENRTLQSIR